MYSLNMVNILSLFQPLIGEVGGVGISLTLKNCILGHIESGVLWGDEDDWGSFGHSEGNMMSILCLCSDAASPELDYTDQCCAEGP